MRMGERAEQYLEGTKRKADDSHRASVRIDRPSCILPISRFFLEAELHPNLTALHFTSLAAFLPPFQFTARHRPSRNTSPPINTPTLPSTMSSSVSSFCLPFCCRVPCSQPADACWNGCVIIEVMPARTASSACLGWKGKPSSFQRGTRMEERILSICRSTMETASSLPQRDTWPSVALLSPKERGVRQRT